MVACVGTDRVKVSVGVVMLTGTDRVKVRLVL
jgi:hypothetical protein